MDKETVIGFIGLGYAGLPIACLLATKYRVVGYDYDARRIDELNQGRDQCGVPREELATALAGGAVFTNDLERLRECNFYVIVVPTPVDKDNKVDLECVRKATEEVAAVIGKGDIVVYESTVYPGVTEDFCAPIIEKASGLRFNEDFFLGYAPERVNPGDKVHVVANITKITSGSTPEAARTIDEVYRSVLAGGTFPVSSIKVAEAAKVVENTQRDVNIAFINEVAMLMNAIGIDTREVIDAMDTKWNALGFRPGLVGGHCISVDPFYLIECARRNRVDTPIMSQARSTNDGMAEYVANRVAAHIGERGTEVSSSRILMLGITFKENCPDIRNSKAGDVYRHLKRQAGEVTVVDPWASPELVRRAYGMDILHDAGELDGEYDAIVAAVAHEEFRHMDYVRLLSPKGFIYDVKSVVPRTFAEREVYRL